MTVESFLAGLPFTPDPFQVEAIRAIAAGESVVVTAPTGAGKTLVAEAAVHLAIESGKRAFYTTPLKALSNQKYGDFSAVYGPGATGLLTGDNSVNGEGSIVVMTTEVLRNMIYAGSPTLHDLGVVILDEVHYLQDPYRGAVWEEVIIHLDRRVPLVSLSATVSNAAQFTAWVEERRGPTRLIVESRRPVPLQDLYMVGDRYSEEGYDLFPVFVATDGRRVPNSKVTRLLRNPRGRRRRFATPRRVEVVEALAAEGLLPAIYFIFSRAGCEAAADRVAESAHRLTRPEEAQAVAGVALERTAHLADDDLRLLGFDHWLQRLQRGVAAHHAGMVPAFKETVEALFSAGLVKVVFATETLSLGINMPARSVVLESLSKFSGEQHELLQPGDYTQLTGRAGRRGIDTEGVAVVLYSPYVPFERVTAIAGAGSHPLVSSFRPTYNMTVNLIANYPRERAEELLSASFAQYQRGDESTALEDVIAGNREALREAEEAARCDLGDIWEYLTLTEEGSEQIPSPREAVRSFVQRTRQGDVLDIPERGAVTRYVMLSRGWTTQPQLLLMSADGRIRRIKTDRLPLETARTGRIRLPEPHRPGEAWFRDAVVQELATGTMFPEPEKAGAALEGGHPVALCPDLRSHLRWARRSRRLRRDLVRQERRIERNRRGLVDELEALLGLLESWRYTNGWKLTERGERLRFIYNELDLLVAEAAASGLFDDLEAAAMAALVSCFVYQPRAGAEAGSWPTGLLEERGEAIVQLHARLVDAERDRGLDQTRAPEPGFAAIAHAWAAGATLEDLFEGAEPGVGDFVRNCRQILDLLRQLRDAFSSLAPAAGRAILAVDRGVVAAGGVG